MARWLVTTPADGAAASQSLPQLVALLSTLIFFYVCVTMLLGLCADHSNPQALTRQDHSSDPERNSLAVESMKHFSQRFSASAIPAKLSSSFRISSFRENSSSSFRNSSFRIDCRQAVDVVDTLRRSRSAVAEEDSSSSEPAVWQRAILLGERCAPLSFSGLILYDEKGNHLPCSLTHTTEGQELHTNQQTTKIQSPNLQR